MDSTLELPQKFTHATIVDYVANKNNVQKKVAKDMIDSYVYALEQGILAKNRVPLGNFGKMYVHVKPASKERKGVNPATGEAITIGAKPASCVPKFGFSKAFKELVKNSTSPE